MIGQFNKRDIKRGLLKIVQRKTKNKGQLCGKNRALAVIGGLGKSQFIKRWDGKIELCKEIENQIFALEKFLESPSRGRD